MTTQTGSREDKRIRLTIDIDPDLHTRLKIAAAQAHISMREIVEILLRESLPSAVPGSQMSKESAGLISSASLEHLLRTRAEIMRDRHFSDDSVDLLREAREEREEQLS